MKTTDYIGIKPSNEVVNGLSQLLADFQVHYANLRGFHWNIKGKSFFVLHEKFESMYNDAAVKVDEIAERILTLGSSPENRLSTYASASNVKEVHQVTDGAAALQSVLETYKVLIAQERSLLKAASDSEDEGTVALMSDYIAQQEKTVWMLVAYAS